MYQRPCLLLLSVVLAVGCGEGGPRDPNVRDDDQPPAETLTPRQPEPDLQVELAPSRGDLDALAELEPQLSAANGSTAAALIASRAPKFASELGYDPMAAANLDLIQRSGLALDQAELEVLKKNGFVLSSERRFANVAYGLESIYAMDLPLYLSVDTILDAMYLSYDDILAAVEGEVLNDALRRMLEGARSRLTAEPRDTATADADLFLSVTLSLLKDSPVAPVAGADRNLVAALFEDARDASAISELVLFGTKRNIDFSQFKPRGHYTRSPELSNYFRAMIWLGRTDLRLIETEPNTGARYFRRRQFDAMLALHDAVQGPARAALDQIDAVVSAFVGEHDYMRISEVDQLMKDLSLRSRRDAKGLSNETIAQRVLDEGYGAQRIASQVLYRDPGKGPDTLPLDRSFALLGQRYVVDSHVLSNVVFDRVPKSELPLRLLPNPLDVAYAAFGNDAALPLLRSELETYGYAPQLERTRKLVEAHEPKFWQANLYNHWLGALRAMSADPERPGMPRVTATEPWSRRVLDTQLASWSQLRHNTVLYAKQSYTTGLACEYPDAYVDPYPEAFGRIADYAEQGLKVIQELPLSKSTDTMSRARTHFTELRSVANILRDMAQQQLEGVPFNQAQLNFINEAVRAQRGCAGPATFSGWYARLLFDNSDTHMKPVITDVHTSPGPPEGILHVGTGWPRLMVVTVDTCQGPRAYAGVSVAYYEKITELQRLTDEEWGPMARNAPDVPWLAPILPQR